MLKLNVDGTDMNTVTKNIANMIQGDFCVQACKSRCRLRSGILNVLARVILRRRVLSGEVEARAKVRLTHGAMSSKCQSNSDMLNGLGSTLPRAVTLKAGHKCATKCSLTKM